MDNMDDFEVARVLMDALTEATKRDLLRKTYVKLGPIIAASVFEQAIQKQHKTILTEQPADFAYGGTE